MLDEYFINEVKRIYYYNCHFGIESIRQTILISKSINPIEVIQLCNEGFKRGQEIVLQNLVDLQDDYSNKNKEIKEYRRNKDRKQEAKIKSELEIIEFKKKIIQNLAFTIAWQLFLGRREKIARLYTGENGEN